MAAECKSHKTYYMVGLITISFGAIVIYRRKEEKEKCELTHVASLVNLLNGNTGKSWLNLGYWTEGTTSYGQAAESLALKVIEPRRSANNQVSALNCEKLEDIKEEEEEEPLFIDVGCGLGESLNLWMEKFNADENSFGINLSKAEVDIAQLRGVNMISRVRVGNACNIPASDACADVVVAVDAAYHFVTRKAFIAEAGRVLKPEGFFGAADVVTVIDDVHANAVRKAYLRWKRKLVGILVGLPYENMYDSEAYSNILTDHHFTNISIRDVTELVPVGFARWGTNHSGSWLVAAVSRFVSYCFRFGELKFVLVSATKQLEK
jgi:ubiquinone/menaquinone biosynthesis C-methylase UbiE